MLNLLSVEKVITSSLRDFSAPGAFRFGRGVSDQLPTKCPCSLTKINMAAVIFSATVFREQYLKHPMILLAFIWRIHRHTTGMSHKHVEAFQRTEGGGKEEGAWRRGGVSGAAYYTLLSSGLFQAGRKRTHTLWPSSVVVLLNCLL